MFKSLRASGKVRRSALSYSLMLTFFFGSTAASQVSKTTPPSGITIQVQDGIFRVVGWKAANVAPAQGWASLFNVYAGSGDVPAMTGSYAVEGDTLVFRPHF